MCQRVSASPSNSKTFWRYGQLWNHNTDFYTVSFLMVCSTCMSWFCVNSARYAAPGPRFPSRVPGSRLQRRRSSGCKLRRGSQTWLRASYLISQSATACRKWDTQRRYCQQHSSVRTRWLNYHTVAQRLAQNRMRGAAVKWINWIADVKQAKSLVVSI